MIRNSIASTIAAALYIFATLPVVGSIDVIEAFCMAMGAVAMFVAFYNYLLLIRNYYG